MTRWRQYAGIVPGEAPLLASADGKIFLTGPLGAMAVDAQTGADLWVRDSYVFTRWVFQSQSRLRALRITGSAYLVDPITGALENTSGDLPTEPTVSPEGRLYAGYLATPLATSEPPSKRGWPMRWGNPSASGDMYEPGQPTVVRQPKDIRLNPDEATYFDVTCAGSRPFYYQWKRNGEDLAGETNSFIRVLPQNAQLGSRYTVAISNILGKVVSDAALLGLGIHVTAFGPGSVTSSLTNVVEPNADVTLLATAATNSRFLRWEGTVESTNNPLTIHATRNYSLVARFETPPGYVLWRKRAPVSWQGQPVIDERGKAFVAFDQPWQTKELDVLTGEFGWSVNGFSRFFVDEERLYSTGGGVFAVDKRTGAPLWRNNTPGTYSWGALTANGSLIVGGGQPKKELMSINRLTGATTWEKELYVTVGRVFGLPDGNFVVLRGYDTYIFDAAGTFVQSLGRSESAIPFNGTTLMFLSDNAFLYNAPDQSIQDLRDDYDLWRSVAGYSNMVYLGSTRYSTFGTRAINTLTMTERWSDLGTCLGIFLDDDSILVGKNGLAALDGQTGAVRWTTSNLSQVYSAAISDDGIILTVGAFELAAVQGPAKLAQTSWPSYFGNSSGSMTAPIPKAPQAPRVEVKPRWYGASIEFETRSGRQYELQSTTNITNPQWQSVDRLSGNAFKSSFSVYAASNQLGFFRVVTRP